MANRLKIMKFLAAAAALALAAPAAAQDMQTQTAAPAAAATANAAPPAAASGAAPIVLREELPRGADGKIAVPAPPPGMGQIIFFRTGGQGFALGCQVVENGERVSALGAGDYFVYQAPPGPRTFVVSSEAKDVLNLEIEPDETQFVRCKIQMGIMVGRPNIAPSNREEFDRNSHKLELVDLEDMGPKAKAGAASGT